MSVWGHLVLDSALTQDATAVPVIPLLLHSSSLDAPAGLPASPTSSTSSATSTIVVIGRSPACTIVLTNPCVSGTHCILRRSEPQGLQVVSSSGGDASSSPVRRDNARVSSPSASSSPPPPAHLASLKKLVEYHLTDTSTNGVYVNGRLVGKGNVVAVHNGDVVELVRGAVNRSSKHNLAYRLEMMTASSDVAAPGDHHQGAEVIPMKKAEEDEEVSSAIEGAAPPEQSEPPNRVPPLADSPPPVSPTPMHAVDALLEDDEDLTDDELRDGESGSAAGGAPRPGEEEGGGSLAVAEERARHSTSVALPRRSTTVALRERRHQPVEQFYTLDTAAPLGKGAFADVYRATLREDETVDPSLRRRLFGDSGSTSLARLSSSSSSSPPSVFAVKVIKKNRMFVDSASQLEQDDPAGAVVDAQQRRLMIEFLNDEEPTTSSSPSPRTPSARIARRRQLYEQLTPANKTLIEKELKNRQRQQREIDILTAVRHPNVVRLYELFESRARLCFVMELAMGGELFPLVQQIGALPEFYVKVVLFQILRGIEYLHQVGIVHRDLKLENVLLGKSVPLTMLCQIQRDATNNLLKQKRAQEQQAGSGGGTRSGDSAAAVRAKRMRDTDAYSSVFQEAAPPVPRGVLLTGSNCVVSSATAAAALTNLSDSDRLRLLSHQQVALPRNWWPLIKISDFGLSRMVGRTDDNIPTATAQGCGTMNGGLESMSTMCGTPLYAAPEITISALRGSPGAGYTQAVDLFSAGVICFAMLCGRPPFPAQRDARGQPVKGHLDYLHPLSWERRQQPDAKTFLMKQTNNNNNNSNGDTTSSHGGEIDVLNVPYVPISAEGKDLTSRLLAIKPSRRLSVHEALNHTWFQECHAQTMDGPL